MLKLNLIILIVTANLFACSEDKNSKIPEISTSDKFKIEIFAENLKVPWSIIFTDENRILVNERPGRIRLIENGIMKTEPLAVFDDVSSNSEEGLMGLDLDPDYKLNSYIYVSYAYEKSNSLWVKITRFKDNGYNLSDAKVIFDNIPAARFHAGCRIKFGPDKKLYITTGDAGERKYAQDIDNLYGKILRINPDGSIPEDNPFKNSPVWSFGHRNPQGIDWYPGTNIMWSTEHGPSGFDGPGGGDEVNVIVKGGNYGWPVVSHTESSEGLISPILVFTPAEAPASGMFYKSNRIGEFVNTFLFGCLRGNGIIVVKIDENDKTKAASFEKIATEYGRIRDITEGPDGYIYFSSSNLDGRGNPLKGDDKIYRIITE